MSIVIIFVWIIASVVLATACYRALFTFSYLLLPDPDTTKRVPERLHRFAAIIPAHDEELLIDEVILSIRSANYDQDKIDIRVIADNCRDQTAAKVRALGEIAHERQDPDNPGKGQAIEWMLHQLDLSSIDAIALFDADNLVDPDFFSAMNRELIGGKTCLQGYYGIANPGESLMTRMLSITYVMKNLLFNAGKAKLNFCVLLMGTGMVFRSRVLARDGWQAMSIGEDLEQTLCLLESGEKIHFVSDALSRAQEATTLGQGYTQRQRWATGRRALSARAYSMIVDGIRLRSLYRVEIGIDILMPSYSKLLNWTAITAVTSLAITPWTYGPAIAVAVALLYQVGEVLIALRIMRADISLITSIAFAPVFLVWKAVIDLLAIAGFRQNEWTRTERQPHTDSTTSAKSQPIDPNQADRLR